MKLKASATVVAAMAATLALVGCQGNNPSGTQGKVDTLTNDQLVERGKYLFEVGDCYSCHTAFVTNPMEKGFPLYNMAMYGAGGNGFAFGDRVVFAANLTKYAKNGAKGETNEEIRDFLKSRWSDPMTAPAPMMPNLTKWNDEDLLALAAYLKDGIKEVENTVPAPVSVWKADGSKKSTSELLADLDGKTMWISGPIGPVSTASVDHAFAGLPPTKADYDAFMAQIMGGGQ